jgi:hypothetical protein
MSIRSSICTLAGTLALSTAVQAASITVWSDNAFRGSSNEFDASIRSLTDLGWNDRISSLRIDAGRWEVCRDVDFRRCRVLDVDDEEIAALEPGWNDTISSLRPVTGVAASSDTAEDVAQRLYRAILGRDADPVGLRNAAAQISRGQIEALVRSMLASTEYRNLRDTVAAPEVLDRMYRALLGRPADTAARRSYLAAIEDGEEVQVIAALLASDEYGGAIDRGETDDQTAGRDLTLEASGAGLVVWGGNGRYESVSGAQVHLGRDGAARIDLTGTTPQTLTGTWTRDSDRLAFVDIPTIAGRRMNGRGWIQLDAGELARVELVAGAVGSRSSAVFTFVADDYTPPVEETRCQQEVRAQIEGDRGAVLPLLFLTPDRSRIASGREELGGHALALADPASFEYRCEVDTRRASVLDASIERR